VHGHQCPGATNLVTGIADAYMDSVPVVAITGQVPQHMIGKARSRDGHLRPHPPDRQTQLSHYGHQRYRARRQRSVLHRADGRPGPVVIDIPKNIQQQRTQPVFPKEIRLRVTIRKKRR